MGIRRDHMRLHADECSRHFLGYQAERFLSVEYAYNTKSGLVPLNKGRRNKVRIYLWDNWSVDLYYHSGHFRILYNQIKETGHDWIIWSTDFYCLDSRDVTWNFYDSPRRRGFKLYRLVVQRLTIG